MTLGVSSEKTRADLKPILREGFTTPDNVQPNELVKNLFNTVISAFADMTVIENYFVSTNSMVTPETPTVNAKPSALIFNSIDTSFSFRK